MAEDELRLVRLEDLGQVHIERPLALINGAFDLLHSGHLRLIYAARQQCRMLVCALDSDDKVSLAKGPGRPVLTFVQRATTLDYLPIDFIVEIENDGDFRSLVRTLQPDLRVLSAEYQGHVSRIPDTPVVWVPNRGIHTSDIITLCKAVP